MAGRANGDNIVACIAIVMVVVLGSISTINAKQGGWVWKLTGLYSVPNTFVGAMPYLFGGGLSLLVVIVSL